MRETKTLAPWVRRFFDEYVVSERNLSEHTKRSYRDAFKLLLPFLSRTLRNKRIDRLTFSDLSSKRVLEFLNFLERERGCSPQTRNQRLAALRSFARYVGSRAPEYVEWSGHIRALEPKKCNRSVLPSLSEPEIAALLAVPDLNTPLGRTEHALLLFLYNTGARASEAVQLTVDDVEFGSNRDSLVTLNGKGGKTRRCPLWKETSDTLAALVAGRRGDDRVFLNRCRIPYTRYGVYWVVKRCAAAVPALADKNVTPHVLRHTTAFMLVRSGCDLNTVRAWLGHASLDTTLRYLDEDVEAKKSAVALCEAPQSEERRPRRTGESLLAFLESV